MKDTPYNLCNPADQHQIAELKQIVDDYCKATPLTPPLSRPMLEMHARNILESRMLSPQLQDLTRVLIGNAVWRSTVAATPYERRILLLPQCLRDSHACQGEFDALGLLCAECGKCDIQAIQAKAEQLGYVVLVAEGTTAVTSLLSRGEADAIIGVSCLHALEQSYAALTANAIPSIAVPLLRNACIDTTTDLDWLFDVLTLRDECATTERIDLTALRRDVEAWFTPDHLDALLHADDSRTARIATDWMAKAGKRLRPLLAAGVYKALAPDSKIADETLRRLAVAAECFHKASLIHDDIEDDDATRYGEKTLHCQYGIAIALNIGDLLIGEGYRLISESGLSPEMTTVMIQNATAGHRMLCLGQGEELLVQTQAEPPSAKQVLDIFRCKTAPAFDVAMQLGAIAAGADATICRILAAFSNAIGIAYQIKDDIDDHASDSRIPDDRNHGPSLLDAMARETGDTPTAVLERARQLQQQYADDTLRALEPLNHAPLKCLLFRIAHLFLDASLS